jgi:hypothetical protein
LILNRIEIKEENIDQLLELLKQTSNLLVANNIGFKLKQYKDNRILSAVIEVISRPETINKRGKLIFCCDGYDCTKYFKLFMDIVLEEPGESCTNAIDLIGEMKGPLSNDQLSKAIDRLGNYIDLNENNDNIPYLKKLKKYLQKLM